MGNGSSLDNGTPAPGTNFRFGRYGLNVDSLEFLRDGQPVAITPKAFDALVLLVRNRHRVVSKDEILKAVWRDAFVSDDSLSQCISSLRRLLADDSAEPQFIATIPRRGYRFIAAVTDASPPAPAPSPRSLPTVDELAAAHVRPPLAPTAPTPRRVPWAVVLTALLSVSAGLLAGTTLGRDEVRPLRVNLQPPLGNTLASGAVLSPDGTMAAFVAEDRTFGRRLWVAPLRGGDARALTGTDGAAQPFWSPDSAFLGFFAAGALKKVAVAAGQPQTIAPVGIVPAGASWADGTILFAGFRSSINAVADTGGPLRTMTTVDVKAGDLAHEWPEFLPGDGGRFLFSIDSIDPDRAGTYVTSLQGDPPRRLVASQHARYAPPGHLVYVRDQALVAQAFNANTAQVGGEPVAVGGSVSPPSVRNGASISAAAGLLAYGGGMAGGRLVWLDRAGQQVASTDARDLHNPALLSPGGQVLVDSNGVWLVDFDKGTTTPLAPDGSTPVPSPDGRRFVFNAARSGGVNDLYIKSIGATDDELLLQTTENKLANDWTRDGHYLVYAARHPRTGRDLWLLPMTGARTPVPFAVGPGNEIQAQVSPDGRWIAYASNESGTWQVYVQSFPTPGSKRTVSPGGGAKPQWRPDGRELFYLAPDRSLMAAPVDAAGDIGRPQALFQPSVVADLSTYRTQFAVSADGQRFLFDAADPASAREPITVLVNWDTLLAR